MRRMLAAVTVSCFLLAAATASSDTASRTRYWDEKARAAFQRGQFDIALSYFMWVYEQTPSAGAAYNLALTCQQANHSELEFTFLQEYLEHTDTDTNRHSRVQARLERLRQSLALLRVESDPPGARIVMDRMELGDYGTTPRTIVAQPAEHTLYLTRDGYHPVSVNVTATKGRQVVVKSRLRPRTGALRVSAPVATAQILLLQNGLAVRALGLNQTVELPIGTYLLRLEAEGHQTLESRVSIGESQTEHVVMAPTRLAPKQGRLLVSASVREARVSVDGKLFGATPLSTEATTGVRDLEIRAPGCVVWRGRVRIEQDKTAMVSVQLECPKRP